MLFVCYSVCILGTSKHSSDNSPGGIFKFLKTETKGSSGLVEGGRQRTRSIGIIFATLFRARLSLWILSSCWNIYIDGMVQYILAE